jgi:hypothetical protein
MFVRGTNASGAVAETVASVIALLVVAAILVKFIIFGAVVLGAIFLIGWVSALIERRRNRKAYLEYARQERIRNYRMLEEPRSRVSEQTTEVIRQRPVATFEDALRDAKADGRWP